MLRVLPVSRSVRVFIALLCASACMAARADEALQRLLQRAEAAARVDWPKEALSFYRDVLAKDPRSMEARYGEARMLLWLDRYDEAGARYEAILREHPDDKEATLGLARAHNWAGLHNRAAAEYAAAESLWPDDASIRLERARALRWAGRDREALALLAGSEDADATRLRAGIFRDLGHYAFAGWENSSDSDELAITAKQVSGGWRFAPTRRVEASWRHAHLEQGGETLYGDEVVLRLNQAHEWAGPGLIWTNLSAGVRDYEGWTTPAWRASVKWLPADRLRVDAEAGNEIIENRLAITERVEYTSASVGVDLRVIPRVTLAVGAGVGQFDDDNTRTTVRGRAEAMVWARPRVTVGWEGLRLEDSKPQIYRGYYNPDRYDEHKLVIGASTTLAGWQASVQGGLGRLEETPGGKNDLYTWRIGAIRELSEKMRLHLAVGRNDSSFNAGQGGGGYKRTYGQIHFTLFHW